MGLLHALYLFVRAVVVSRAALAAENLALRQQLSVIDQDIRDLIRRIARENPLWGAPHILSELCLLGYDVAQATVAKYMPNPHKPPSQTWRAFLANHVPDIAAIDFFTVPTLTFRVLYGFLVR